MTDTSYRIERRTNVAAALDDCTGWRVVDTYYGDFSRFQVAMNRAVDMAAENPGNVYRIRTSYRDKHGRGRSYCDAVNVDPPAPAVEVTPLGLAYLLPGIEPRPRVVAEGVNQSALF